MRFRPPLPDFGSLGPRRLDRAAVAGLVAALALLAPASAHAADAPADTTPELGPRPVLRILATGEIHATPDACDCPLKPIGGLARLAAELKKETAAQPDSTLRIDTGAFVAGGPLDTRSAGLVNDRLRSQWMLRFLAIAGYDAVALGDEELMLGRGFWQAAADANTTAPPADSPWAPNLPRLPITCANLTLTPAERKQLNIAETIDVVTAAGRIRVVGLAPPGDYAAGADQWTVTDPLPVLKRLLAAAQADPLHPTLLLASHLGDSATTALLKGLPPELYGVEPVGPQGQADAPTAPPILAVVAGHRRPAEIRQTVAQIPVLYVRGEGEYLSQIDFADFAAFPRMRDLEIAAAGPRDPAAEPVAAAIRALIATARPQVDITMATDCPHCVTALEPIIQTIARLKDHADFHLRYMVHRAADGRWITGIQPGAEAEARSYEETRRLLVVQKYAPEKVWALLRWRKNNPTADFDDGLKPIGFPAWRLKRALAAGEDQALLAENQALTEQRRIPGTPVVHLDGRLYEGKLEELPLSSALCSLLRKRGATDADLQTPCAGVPRCYQDGDCEKPGFIAHCLDAGKPTAECQFIEDREVTIWVVQDPRAMHSNAAELIGQLGRFFAKMKVEPVAFDSDLGRQLIATTEQRTLPIYVVKNLADAVNQADVEKFGRYLDTRFLLQPLPFYSHDFFTRKRTPGTLDVFYEVHSPNAAKAILRLNSTLQMFARQHPDKPLPRIRLHPRVYLQPADPATLQPEKLIARGGLGELEQSARLLAVAELTPAQTLAYAELCAQTPGTTYWDRALRQLQLDPATVAAAAATPAIAARLADEARLAQELRIDGDIGFLARNREMIPIQNGDRLWQVLEQLQADLAPAQPPPHPEPLPNLPFAPLRATPAAPATPAIPAIPEGLRP